MTDEAVVPIASLLDIFPKKSIVYLLFSHIYFATITEQTDDKLMLLCTIAIMHRHNPRVREYWC
jgi:hypothetical protein